MDKNDLFSLQWEMSENLQKRSSGWRVGVALSGGADSSALLMAAVAKWPNNVVAFHVHHGLQSSADSFEQYCVKLCNRLHSPLVVMRINAQNSSGESPEDAARKARYRALAEMALQHGASAVLIAQHADDQVETLLLALSRGAGLPGLSAMPLQFERHGVTFCRPLLETKGSTIRSWLANQGVTPIEDPSNVDIRYTRNKIRQQLIPVLATAFPQFRKTFARSAKHAAQAQLLLVELAQNDLALVDIPPNIKLLQTLSQPRQANLLRYWLSVQHATPSAAQLDQLLLQVAACTTRGHQIHLKVAAGHVTRQAACLHYAALVPGP